MAQTKRPPGADFTLITDDDLYLFNEGSHFRLHEKLGSHPVEVDGTAGTYFAVWAPNCQSVSVVGDFNGWDPRPDPLRSRSGSGIWEGFVPGAGVGAVYKFHLVGRGGHFRADKADPFARMQETPPKTGSIIWADDFRWTDVDWMSGRHDANSGIWPWSIYELHAGSWRHHGSGRPLGWRELAEQLVPYLNQLGFTHVELLPVMEHPFYGSWGYQTTGYFAPTSRYGTPEDFKAFVDTLHRNGLGLLIDWVPSHFPSDPHGLAAFDGTALYEHADPRLGYHPDWNSLIFNYGRHEVRSFLVSSAVFWLQEFHADGLRVDAVASMLYRDYSRKAGEWIPNRFGGRENLDAIEFLRRMNAECYVVEPAIQTVAEESTAWPMVSRPTYVGGLGFGMKWDMGWMHDTLDYLAHDPVHRRFHHNQLTFRGMYAFSENFVLPLSHDEVVHGKGSLIGKMPGDDWQKFGNLRLLFAYMWAQPGKKLLFMGGEFGQWREWSHDRELDWALLQYPPHAGLLRLVEDLNRFYRANPAMHQLDFSADGFRWIDANDSEQSILTFMRLAQDPADVVVCAFNFTPVPRHDYRVGIPSGGWWTEALNTDAPVYGGSGQGNLGGKEAAPIGWHGQPYSIAVTLPPLGAVYFKPGVSSD
jgi:1,4-alpha-glucan branching enzyme